MAFSTTAPEMWREPPSVPGGVYGRPPTEPPPNPKTAKWFLWTGNLKPTTCAACAAHIGKIYSKEELKKIKLPPLHPNCGCEVVPLDLEVVIPATTSAPESTAPPNSTRPGGERGLTNPLKRFADPIANAIERFVGPVAEHVWSQFEDNEPWYLSLPLFERYKEPHMYKERAFLSNFEFDNADDVWATLMLYWAMEDMIGGPKMPSSKALNPGLTDEQARFLDEAFMFSRAGTSFGEIQAYAFQMAMGIAFFDKGIAVKGGVVPPPKLPVVKAPTVGSKGNTAPAQLPANNAQIGHIFTNAKGHLPDTLANRKLLINTASNPNNLLGVDIYGNKWFTSIQSDGGQVWVQTRNGIIQNGGINYPPKPWNPTTGLSSPTKPTQKGKN